MCDRLSATITIFLVLLLIPVMAAAEAGGGGGCGDVFGDLIHIQRHAATGQPILQKRWVEVKDGHDWGYCPIPLDATGKEIGFAPDSCDPADPDAVVEVDYFGRLNGGRTKERNSRMHFDEVIANIKLAGMVKQDETGRLKLGYDCQTNRAGEVSGCSTWSTIDSPMASLALYTRLMKYGHLQTDPAEVDIWAHGDPAAGIQTHLALDAGDWKKFHQSVRHLLPARDCFAGGVFDPACQQPESLDSADFVRAASFLGAAANKGGKITVDLVQYMNRILKITQDTETTSATLATLPALVRDCGPDPANQLPPAQCSIVAASAGLAAPADETFVDFGATGYLRSEWREETLEAILPMGIDLWQTRKDVPLLDWLNFVNKPSPANPLRDVNGFVSASSDALRAIEFIHNYAVPEDLGWTGF